MIVSYTSIMDTTNMLHILVWKWHQPGYEFVYTAEHVNIMDSMLRRNLSIPYRLICITDDPTDINCETYRLWNDLEDLPNDSWKDLDVNKDKTFPSCYRRLKIFTKETTRALGINDNDRVVSMDLDMVITANLDALFDREENFVGWHGGSGDGRKLKLNGYNGSLWMFRAGTCEFLWDEFDREKSPTEAKEAGYYGSDQGWLSYKLYGNNPQWTCEDGVCRYYPVLSKYEDGKKLPPGTKIAVFCGKWKPWQDEVIVHSPWIKKHYK